EPSTAASPWRCAHRLAELDARETPDPHVLAGRRGEPRHQLADGLRGVPDVGLLEQLVDVLGVHRRDLHRDLSREPAEVGIPRDEVRLARELHERADLAAGVDVRLDDAFLGLAVRRLLRFRETALADERRRLLEVPLRVFERALAVHHAGTGLGPETLDVLCVGHLYASSFSSTVSASSAGGSA